MDLSDSVLDVGIINSNSLMEKFCAHPKVEDFLRANIQIAMHSTTVTDAGTFLNFSFDIDGLVVELKRLQGVAGGLHYLLLPGFTQLSLKPHYHFIKKHMDLTQYSNSGIIALKNAVGHTLGYVDGGYHLLLTAIPQSCTNPLTRLLSKDTYTGLATELFNMVTSHFQDLLRGLPDQDKKRPSIKKQSSMDTSRFHILRRDSTFVYSLVDKAVKKVNGQSPDMKILLLLNQFGQKDTYTLDLSDIVAPSMVRSISVHFACNIVTKDPSIHLLFSRYGLQDLIGFKGTLFSVLGMHEATNFQSNLDNTGMDVSRELLDILSGEGLLTFLQLYVDSPHAHVKIPFKHPVSGALVTCGLSHPSFQTSVLGRAWSYIQHMTDLHQRMAGQLGCRIEQVVRLKDLQGLMSIEPSQHFDTNKLTQLLERHAILVPFKDSPSGGLVRVLREVTAHFVKTLEELYQQNKGVARYSPVWQAFQIELALEEMLYGRPLSPMDFQLSVALGTSTVSNQSCSHQRGFIGLAPHWAATREEIPPPLHHWTKQPLQQDRIERLFPLCQVLDTAPPITGAALINVLLGDLYKRNKDIPMAALKSTNPPGRVTGALQLEPLCEDLATNDYFPVPNTFARACELVRSVGKDVKDCLVQGFAEAKINFLPAFKSRDFKGCKRIWWNLRDYVQVCSRDVTPLPIALASEITTKVCVEVERRSLSYPRNLDKYRQHGMPWMEKVLSHLPPDLKKHPNSHLKVLTFVSCVGLIMNKVYVDYQQLTQLLRETSDVLTQAQMQNLHILSRTTLPIRCGSILWKLHEDIPFRAPIGAHSLLQSHSPPQEVQEETLLAEPDVQQPEPQDDIQPMERSQAMYLPARSSKPWTAEELSLIPTDTRMKTKVAYEDYSRRCKEKKLLI